jgi:hypothetical protein
MMEKVLSKTAELNVHNPDIHALHVQRALLWLAKGVGESTSDFVSWTEYEMALERTLTCFDEDP